MITQLRHPGFDSAFETLGIKHDKYIDNIHLVDSLFYEDKRFVVEVIPKAGNFWEIQQDMILWENNLKQEFPNVNFQSWTKSLSALYNKNSLIRLKREQVLERYRKIDLFKNLIGKDTNSFLVIIEVEDDDPEINLAKFYKVLETTDFRLEYKFNSTSEFHLENSINQSMTNDLTIIIGLLFLFFVLIMFWAYRNIFSMLYLSFLVGISLVVGLFVQRFTGLPLNLITIMVLPVVVVLSASNAVHLLTAFFSEDDHLTYIEKLTKVYKKYLLPSMLTSLTTAVAFFSLAFNTTKSVIDLGWITGISVIISFVICFFMSPFLFQFAPIQKVRKQRLARISNFFIDRKKIFSYILTPLLFIAIVLLPKLQFKNNFELFIPMQSDAKIQHDNIRDNYYSQATLDMLVQLKDTADRKEQVKGLEDKLELLSHINVVKSSATKSVVMTKFFIPIELADASGYTKKFEANNGFTQRFQIGTKQPDDLIVIETDIDSLMNAVNLPNYKIASVVLAFNNVNASVGKSLLLSLLTSSLFLFIVFFLMTRSLPQSLIGLFANLVPLSAIVIIFVAFNLHINIMTAITAVVCLGIIVDDTIHSFYRRVVLDRPLEELSVGMLTTTIILIVGFGIFAISDIRPVGIFGGVAAIVFAITLISDLTILLYLLELHEKWKAKKALQ